MCLYTCRCATSTDVVERERRGDASECGRVVQTTQEAQAVHSLPDHDTRARVRQQLVHNPPEALGDRLPAASQRAAGQGLVPEPADEAQETERAGEENDIPRRGLDLPALRVVAAVQHVISLCPAPHVAITSDPESDDVTRWITANVTYSDDVVRGFRGAER